MATILPFTVLLLFLAVIWRRFSGGTSLRMSRETAALQAYLAWKPAEADRT